MTLQDKLYLAPIEDPKRILDVGTGTGIWATDMADKFPSAEVIGTDLSPVQPGMQPDNCRFEIDDAASEWVSYPDSHFDLIHVRGLFGSLSDWPAFYAQVFRHLRPGAWFEQVEFSCRNRGARDGLDLDPETTVLGRWSANAELLGRATGKTFAIAEEMGKMLEGAGFEGVVEKRFKWPIGPWSSDPKLKEIGRWNLLNWEEGMEGWVLALYTRVFGVSWALASEESEGEKGGRCRLTVGQWTHERVQEWLKEVRAALRDRRQHVYHEVRLVYARKPE